MDPRSYAALKEETEGEYGGVGLELATRGEDVVVVAPIDDTPASRAGFQPGDRLIEIDGRAVHGWRETEAVRALTGSPGTKVTLKAHRAGWAEPRSFTLVRDVIRIVSVEEKLFDRKLAYVKVKSFQDRTDLYLRKALDSMHDQAGGQLSGIVLDLRHNPGGLLDQAVKVADRFLDGGVTVTPKGRGRGRCAARAQPPGSFQGRGRGVDPGRLTAAAGAPATIAGRSEERSAAQGGARHLADLGRLQALLAAAGRAHRASLRS